MKTVANAAVLQQPALNKKKKNFQPANIVLWVLLSFLAVLQIFPLIWLLDFSLASSNEMFTSGLLIWPKQIRWDNYVSAFVDGHFLLYFRNSLFINVLAVVLVLLLSVMLSFACTRMHWKLSGLVKGLILLGIMIPIHATLLPNYVIYDRLHLTDTLWALLIPYIAFSLPQGLFLTSGFMESIPREIEEAAMIDGAGIYRILFQIITPMLKTSLVTVSIMTFLNNWNEFMMASTYLSSPKWKTLPFSVLEFTGMYSSNYAVQFAVMALTAAPMVIIYILLNKQITRGVAMGAVKG
ncbi:MAG: carbohydrate ABC transporter permease [Pygmaiobacter sp.]|nr:carbohydrate ABC transporter permease [Pygmaiobacter sp.]